MTQSEYERDVRPSKSVGTIILLVVLTLANGYLLLVGIAAWLDAVDHGDEDLVPIAATATVATVIALVGLGGAWFTRKWGPRVYVTVAGIGLLVGLTNEAFSPLSLVGVGLAVVLLVIAEVNW
jgi:hypothetical protein